MLRTWRQQGWRAFGFFVSASFVAIGPARAADPAFEPQSTLAPQVAPQNLSVDAAIDSLVRRGLLANLNAAAPRAEVAPPASTIPVTSGWRSPRSGAGPAAPPPAVAPAPTIAPTTQGWRPAGQGGAPAAQPHPTPSPFDDMLPAVEPTTPPATPPTESLSDAFGPTLVAARPTEPATSDDPLPDDSLAPIDDLPETPAPASDAPGDPVEPGIGDAQLESALGAAARGSLREQSLTPAGEPDRIEQPDHSATPPANPETFQEPEETPPPRRLRPLNGNQIALRDKVRRVLKHYYANPLNTGNRSPWEVMHCMLAFEVHSRVLQGGPTGEPITAVGWLCFNQPCKGRTLMYLNESGQLRVKVGPALQGHHGQLLALLAQARVRSDYPIRVEGRDFTVADLIEMEKLTCYPRTELTFKLLGLQRYLPMDARWLNDQGMQWDFPTLIREEMRQPVRTAACGGTHRLSGLILTVKKRERLGLPIDGEYAAAQRFVANYQNYAYRLQNNDGSFSTEWFKGPGAEEDIDRRLKTTGHQLEFLLYAADEEQLTYYRTVRAVNYLANIMWANRTRDWEAGPLGHAIHALVLYDRLVFAPHDQGAAAGPVAQQPRAAQR